MNIRTDTDKLDHPLHLYGAHSGSSQLRMLPYTPKYKYSYIRSANQMLINELQNYNNTETEINPK